jgi:hypothetical protein
MHSRADSHNADPKCITIGVRKARNPDMRTTCASDISAMTTKDRPVRPAADEPTIT